MLMDLQELLGRDVDLIVEGTLRPYAAESANRDKILIYERKSEG
jgi:predicted nucleotidyltransferase